MEFGGLAPSRAARIVAALTAAGMHASFIRPRVGAPWSEGRVYVEVPPGRESEALDIVAASGPVSR